MILTIILLFEVTGIKGWLGASLSYVFFYLRELPNEFDKGRLSMIMPFPMIKLDSHYWAII